MTGFNNAMVEDGKCDKNSEGQTSEEDAEIPANPYLTDDEDDTILPGKQSYGPSSGFRHSKILRSPVVALMWRLLWAAHSVEMNHAPGDGRIPGACSCFLADTHSH